MNLEVLTYVLSGATFLISVMGGVIWNILRSESKDHSDRIDKKANDARLTEIEIRLQREVAAVDANNRELIKELKQAHLRDIDNLSARLGEAIKSVETNVLARMQLFVDAVNLNNKTHN